MDCLAYMYSPQGKYVQTNFDRNLLTKHSEPVADQQVQLRLAVRNRARRMFRNLLKSQSTRLARYT